MPGRDSAAVFAARIAVIYVIVAGAVKIFLNFSLRTVQGVWLARAGVRCLEPPVSGEVEGQRIRSVGLRGRVWSLV